MNALLHGLKMQVSDDDFIDTNETTTFRAILFFVKLILESIFGRERLD